MQAKYFTVFHRTATSRHCQSSGHFVLATYVSKQTIEYLNVARKWAFKWRYICCTQKRIRTNSHNIFKRLVLVAFFNDDGVKIFSVCNFDCGRSHVLLDRLIWLPFTIFTFLMSVCALWAFKVNCPLPTGDLQQLRYLQIFSNRRNI